MKGKTILITGGAGFIGSNLANKLSEDNDIVIIDDLSMGRMSNLNHKNQMDIFIHDLTDYDWLESIFKTYRFDYIFHFAAVASVADSVNRPLETHKVNEDIVIYMLEYIKKYQSNLERIVFASSAAIYGDLPGLPKTEKSMISPNTPYAIDKYASESYLLKYGYSCGVNASAARFFNVFGKNQNPASPYSGVISILMEKCKEALVNGKATFTCYGDGEQTRDFIYIDDVVNALLIIATSPNSIGEAYNIGYGNPTSLNNIINLMEGIFGVDLAIDYQSERKGDIKYSYCSNQKLKSIGFKPNFSVKKGLERYVNFEMGRMNGN